MVDDPEMLELVGSYNFINQCYLLITKMELEMRQILSEYGYNC